MVAVVALAVVPSLLPIPPALQAFPAWTGRPGRTLLVAVWPKAAMTPPPTVAVLPEDPDKALVLPELDLSTSGTKSRMSRGLSYQDERDATRWELMIKKVGA